MTDDSPASRRRVSRSDASRTTGMQSRAADQTDTMDRPLMDNWSPPNMLEVPPDDGEFTYRWVREYVNGAQDSRNVQMRLREGYVRVNVADLPDELMIAVDEDVKGDGVARTGGLMLMKFPLRLQKQRREYYRSRASQATRAADTLQGVAGRDYVHEDRGTRALEGKAAGRMLQQLSQR